MNDTTPPDKDQIWKFMFKTVEDIRNWHDKLDPRKARYKATLAQLKVMGCIIFSNTGKKRVKDIAEELGITPGAVSQVVDKLVREGVLDRCTDAEDRRSVVISLSEQGREVARAIDGSFGRLMTKLLRGVPPEKLLIVNEVLQMMQHELAAEKSNRLIK